VKAVVLAGGKGTRLRPLTCLKPKPLIPIVNKPIIVHIIESLRWAGIDEFIITLGYLGDQIINTVGDGERFGVSVRYSIEKEPLGTAGSVKNAENLIDDEPFCVVSGDLLVEVDLKKILRFHEKNGATVTMALTEVEDPSQYGIVETDRFDRVIRFLEKPSPLDTFSKTINAGVYILEKDVLDHIPEKTFFDFSNDLFPSLLDKKNIYGYYFDGYWNDLGRIESYFEATMDILSGRVMTPSIRDVISERALYEGGVIIGENSIIDENANIEGPVVIGSNTRIEKDVSITSYSVIGDNVHIHRGVLLDSSIVHSNTRIREESIIKGSIIGEGCNISEKVTMDRGTVIGDNSKIGRQSKIYAGIKIWSESKLGPKTVISPE